MKISISLEEARPSMALAKILLLVMRYAASTMKQAACRRVRK
jgi:hypothetical protein